MRSHPRRSPASPGSPTPTARGVLEGSTTLRVRYSECDPMNVAHHAAYVPWLEIGRTELLREAGVAYADLEAAGIFLVVVQLEVRYRAPVFYDDLVRVRTRWTSGGRVKLVHEYEVRVASRAGQAVDVLAASARTTLARVDREGRPCELPEWLFHPSGL